MSLPFDVSRCRAVWVADMPHSLCAHCQRFTALADLGMRTPVMLAPAVLLVNDRGETVVCCDSVIPE